MLDLSEEPIEENIEICSKYFERMAKIGMTLEIELGVTGGEEDGVDNSDVDDSKLYTQPSEVAYAYEELSKISPNFTIAAAFGNVHGVYKPGNVKLSPIILDNSQKYIQEKYAYGSTAGKLRIPRWIRIEPRGNSGSYPLRCCENESRYRHAMGHVGRDSEILQSKRRLSAIATWKP
jgi:hypothetical protein